MALLEIKGIKNIMEINFLDENTSEFKVELESEDVRKLILTKMMENNLFIAIPFYFTMITFDLLPTEMM